MDNTYSINSKPENDLHRMKSIEELQQIIIKKIDGFCRKNGDSGIYEPINYIMQLGGKRMRPVLCLMSANLFSDEIEDAVYPALAIEVFHNFTLMHDDIMDNAPLRRGKATVHEKWNRDVAILSGDAMVIQSYQLLIKTRPELLPVIMQVFNKTALEVCEGQQLDMDFQQLKHVKVEEYMEMIRLKTSVLLAGAMKIGACIGGAHDEMQNAMYDIAIDLGLSFQLWDDYLDAFGNSAETGKQAGGDILEKKKTFLMLHALERSSDTTKEELDQILDDKNNSDTFKVEYMLNLFRQHGSDVALKEEVERRHASAITSLENLPIEDERKKILRNFALALKERKS
jgi:geranylgeranyl diphosphate synthase, type II